MGDGPLFDGRRSALRERQLTELEREGKALTDALLEDLDSLGLDDAEIAERAKTDRGHLSRVRSRQAHPPQTLIAFAVDHSRHRPPHYLVALSAVGEYEPKPRPPPDVRAVLEAYRDELADMKLDEILRDRVERRLGVVLQPKAGEP